MSQDLLDSPEFLNQSMQIAAISTGFLEIPSQISLNFYAQGCKNECKNCQNKELRSFDGGEQIFVKDLEKILNKYKLSNWVCWLGGDAVYQPDGFKAFNKFFKSQNYPVCLYTGKQLMDVIYLIDDVDLVIDGPWVEELGPIDSPTTNQKIWIKQRNHWHELKHKDLENILKVLY